MKRGTANSRPERAKPARKRPRSSRSTPHCSPGVVWMITRRWYRLPSMDSNRYQRRRSEEHTSELQSRGHLVCRLLLEKKKTISGRALDDDSSLRQLRAAQGVMRG